MESLALSHNPTKFILCFKNFRNIVIIATKEQNKKIQIKKICIFVLLPFPLGTGGECCCKAPHQPHTFSTAKVLEFLLKYGYLDKGWVD